MRVACRGDAAPAAHGRPVGGCHAPPWPVAMHQERSLCVLAQLFVPGESGLGPFVALLLGAALAARAAPHAVMMHRPGKEERRDAHTGARRV